MVIFAHFVQSTSQKILKLEKLKLNMILEGDEVDIALKVDSEKMEKIIHNLMEMDGVKEIDTGEIVVNSLG